MMVMGRNLKAVEILLVEDNPVDILMTKHALEEAKVFNKLHVVEDGEDAIAFLYQQGEYTDVPRPDLILLDLNLPRKSGREVLAEIKQDPRLLQIPVIILTTSEEERDIAMCYKNHGNCFITKPVDMEQFTGVVKTIEGFWFTIVNLPPREQG
jgi:two-component system, chemotaxis family, response regulator Rcp1